MARTFDYSKWDNIELSDDEDDLHPNIDKDSWFRLKHRTRLEREEKEDKEIKEYESKNEDDNARLNVINARLRGIDSGEADGDSEFEDVEALNVEATEIKQAMASRNARIAEIRERRKWNIDNICVVKDEKTVVNSAETRSLKPEIPLVNSDVPPKSATTATTRTSVPSTVFTGATKTASTVTVPSSSSSNSSGISSSSSSSSSSNEKKGTPAAGASSAASSPAPAQQGAEPAAAHMTREKLSVVSYNDYVIGHERVLETYSEIADLEATKEFLFKHCDILMHEHSQTYLLLSCLEDEMNGKHKRMKLVCRQSQILSHVQELGVSMRRDPRDVILPFFKRIEVPEYLKGFLSAVDDFILKIQKRAVEKRKEMAAEKAQRRLRGELSDDEEEGDNEVGIPDRDSVPVGPGGLHPFDVLKTLPKALREAFESQDIARLQRVIQEMEPAEAKTHMKRCVDSGLWVAKDESIFEDADEEEEGGEDEVEEGAGKEEIDA